MFHVILFEPEIPPNTGNVIRLCANSGMQLHLVRPLGFTLDDSRLRRAGLDYREWASVRTHDHLSACLAVVQPRRLWACSTKGQTPYSDALSEPGDAFLFGPETRGLPQEILASLPTDQILRLPMVAESRSLNLSNTVAVVIYDAWRRQHFQGGR